MFYKYKTTSSQIFCAIFKKKNLCINAFIITKAKDTEGLNIESDTHLLFSMVVQL